jgi:tetratricopeptide (TPR) repeat protein
VISLIYAIFISGSLASLAKMAVTNMTEVINQTARLEGLLTQFYIFLLLILLGLAGFLPEKWPGASKKDNFIGNIITVVLVVTTIWMSVRTNLRIIHADVAFKMAEPFANSNQWPVANVIYRRSIELSPDEDYYYLFLGRGLLEEAKAIEDPIQQEQAFLAAETDLKRAQEVNPLNPDHTANLARLHSWWALQTSDENERISRGAVSDHYYSRVTVLSPNNARLWDEWAILYLNVLRDPDKALEKLTHSLEIDPQYDWTHALLGDYYNQESQKATEESHRIELAEQAVYHYQQAIEYAAGNVNYYFALAGTYQNLNDIDMVIQTLETSLEFARNSQVWQIEENLANIYLQQGDGANALIHAQKALVAAPEDQQERLTNLIAQIQSMP